MLAMPLCGSAIHDRPSNVVLMLLESGYSSIWRPDRHRRAVSLAYTSIGWRLVLPQHPKRAMPKLRSDQVLVPRPE